jgi:adenosylcobinamide-GDP ribazoletransferase
MRDSRIGSYGALALVLSLAIRISAVSALAPTHAGTTLLVTGILSRTAMLPMLVLLPAARPDGLGRGLGRIPPLAVALAVLIAGAATLLCVRPLRGATAVAIACTIGLAAAALAHRRIGGQTGDVLGACCGVTDCVLLTLFAAG